MDPGHDTCVLDNTLTFNWFSSPTGKWIHVRAEMVLVIDFYRWVTYLAAPAVYSKGSQKDQVALQYKNTRKGQGNNENNTKRTQNKIKISNITQTT